MCLAPMAMPAARGTNRRSQSAAPSPRVVRRGRRLLDPPVGGHAGKRVHTAQVPRYAVFTHQLLRAVLQEAISSASGYWMSYCIGCATTPRPVTINGEQ